MPGTISGITYQSGDYRKGLFVVPMEAAGSGVQLAVMVVLLLLLLRLIGFCEGLGEL